VNLTVTQTGPWSLQAEHAEILVPPYQAIEPVEVARA
jgi:hypothetical protein